MKQTEFRRWALWQQPERLNRTLLTVNFEITARCNNDCGHCYVNRSAADQAALDLELTSARILALADEAVEMGCLWCLISGGEPLLRDDFEELYLGLKCRGMLVSVFTNATLVSDAHVRMFRRFPPRDLEVSVYGVTAATYERVTRRKGSFEQFSTGLKRLLDGGVKVNLKTVALASNLAEMAQIADFCRGRSHAPYRFDTQLHLRHDRDPRRNAWIQAERLTFEQIAELEGADALRRQALAAACPSAGPHSGDGLFFCSAGLNECTVGSDGRLRLCTSMVHPDLTVDMHGSCLSQTWKALVPRVRGRLPVDSRLHATCGRCRLIDLCQQCPAHAWLETGLLDQPVERFCREAHARAGQISGQRIWKHYPNPNLSPKP